MSRHGSKWEKLSVPTFSSELGHLTACETILPFSAVRTFWIYGVPANGIRGGHRHKSTRQALIAINGHVSVFLEDENNSTTIDLANPSECLIVEPEDWHTMEFGESAILLVMASTMYDANDYIYERY